MLVFYYVRFVAVCLLCLHIDLLVVFVLVVGGGRLLSYTLNDDLAAVWLVVLGCYCS